MEGMLFDYAAACRASVCPPFQNLGPPGLCPKKSPPDKGTKPGALLFAVIGAKLSEGLNFSDDLARAVIIIGLPFANLGSPELQERMKYVNRLETKTNLQRKPGQKDAASELYENMCMNAVNQSIGKINFVTLIDETCLLTVLLCRSSNSTPR